MPQPFSIKTPLPASDLQLESFTCSEGLSALTHINASLLSARSDIDPNLLLGQPVTIEITLRDDAKRHFHGFVSRFSAGSSTNRFFRYQAVVRPWLWFLTRTSDCRIFQAKKVREIAETVFADHPIALQDFKLFREYRVWEYCVQYRESDFNFVSRLLEHEGIYYRFEHSADQHQLVLTDSSSAHDPQPDGAGELEFFEGVDSRAPDIDVVSRWSMTRSVQPGKFAMTDFDFQIPRSDLLVEGERQRSYNLSDAESFDFVGGYTKTDDGLHYLENRRDETQSRFEVFSGSTNSMSLRPGFTFKLRRHPRNDQNIEYLVTDTNIQAQNGSLDAGLGGGAGFHCEFTAIPAAQQYRPPRRTPKPFVQGPQTAIVVGAQGDEIHTDKFGRVRIQFHWDRLGQKNEKSSCMVRVAQAWAGKNFGAMFVPRVGHEVIVDFLEGDPDQPIITGCVYNGDNPPPWKLPDHATQSGVLTRSSKGGAVGNANMIRFEDKKGSEQVAVHAERNLDTSVEADESHTVGHDRTKTIEHDETSKIKNDRTKTVVGNETTEIGKNRIEHVAGKEFISVDGIRAETVGADETVRISGNRIHAVDSGDSHQVGTNHSQTVGADQTLKIGANRTDGIGGNLQQTIGGNFTQKVGGNIAMNTPGKMTVTAAGGVTFIAPGGTKFVDQDFTFLGGTIHSDYAQCMEGFAYHVELTTMAVKVSAIDLDFEGLCNKKAQIVLLSAALQLSNASGASIEKTALALRKADLTIIP